MLFYGTKKCLLVSKEAFTIKNMFDYLFHKEGSLSSGG